ncbi:elicitin-like protein SOL13H [Phytophthora cinnamomi]|uniref:elicitin-like protein SOL13H n=1 Tax=Phytophthora cinnamomi TaxID=4785 RepID=UPI0035596BD2|nr:elicitin-like protein SOL13H [Phytophthora cinnamomi]
MWMIPWLVVVVAIGSVLPGSDTCSVFQIHTTIQAIDGVLSSTDCADYANNGSSLRVPCAAASCVGLVDDLVSKLPNCTLGASANGGTSRKEKVELQNALGECSADSSSSISVKAVATSVNGATTSATSGSANECTSAEASTTAQLYLNAAESSACGQYSSMDESSSVVYINAPCSATECVSVMETLVGQLPDCYSDGVNLKVDVARFMRGG